uniref:Uncharacterized protein n=1 Tax=Cacopsylla melanoneura TaxID=428564 RepID=A0A8D8ZML5_9HEMI
MKSLMKPAIFISALVAALILTPCCVKGYDGDDFFSELEDLENLPTEPPPTTTLTPTRGSSSADGNPFVPVVDATGTILANYTPEIGYKMADKLSDQIRLFLKHFQQKDPIGIPGAVLPDPMPLQDLSKSMGLLGSVSFKNVKLYELSQFRLTHINTDLEHMQVYVEIEMKRLVSLGDYSMKTMMKNAKGPFNITMVNVVAEGAVALERDEATGQLQATDSQMDMSCQNIIIDLKNSGMAAFVDSLGPFMFQSIKPVLLRKLNTDIRADVNKQIKKFTAKIPKDVSPLDLGIQEARRYMRKNHYDPYQLKNYSYKINLMRINVSDLWIEGLSNFNRVGDLSLSMDKGIIQFGVHVITSRLTGSFNWSVQFSNKRNIVETGKLKYTVDYLQVRLSVNQSVNINHKPVINDIDLSVGKIIVKHDGLKAFDFIIDNVVNHYVPDLLKFIIIDSIEVPLKVKAQDILEHSLVDNYSIDAILNEKVLPQLDEFVLNHAANKTYEPVVYDTTPIALKLTTTLPTTTPVTTTAEATTSAGPIETVVDTTTTNSTVSMPETNAREATTLEPTTPIVETTTTAGLYT